MSAPSCQIVEQSGVPGGKDSPAGAVGLSLATASLVSGSSEPQALRQRRGEHQRKQLGTQDSGHEHAESISGVRPSTIIRARLVHASRPIRR